MERLRAVLLDVFDTVLTVDFDAALDGLVESSGLSREGWAAGLSRYGNAVMTGAVTPEEAFAATFELAGRPPPDTAALVRRELELLQEHATVSPDVVDQVVLSCDIGSAKPDAGIYRSALDSLGAEPTEALFVDDQAAYCEGARALGMTAVLIDRRGATPGAVRSLDELMSAAGE